MKFSDLTANMVGLRVSHTWRGHGSAIFVEFGKLRKDPKRNNPQGAYSLMLDCGWRVEARRSILAGSYSSLRRVHGIISKLMDATVIEVNTWGVLPELVVTFDSGLRLLSFSHMETQPDWGLFLPDGSWLGCRRGKITHENKQTRPLVRLAKRSRHNGTVV